MFPIKLTLTVSTVDQLNRLTALVSDGYAAAVADAPKLPAEEAAAAPALLPKKAKPTPAATPGAAAPSQPTAEVVEAAAPVKTADESTPAAPSAATAPAPSTAATEGKVGAAVAGYSAAAASAQSVTGEPFPYAKLQALVFKHLPAHGAALLEVSKKHGAAKFKELPADKWEAAYDDLAAAYGE